MNFEISELRGNTIWQLYRLFPHIQLDPDYQRLSGIWTLDKRQLLLDSILNGFDVPKLYFHKFSRPLKMKKLTFDYAIIDGKQRLETIWQFISGSIALSDDFEFLRDPEVKAGGLTYRELGKEHPELKADFDGYPLSVICVETNDIEMIEDMFTRLNEAANLTAAEKRNAFSGPLPSAIRKLARAKFFTQSLPFQNTRYRHFDLAAKYFLAEHTKKVTDTKKIYLDEFVQNFRRKPRNKIPAFVNNATVNLRRMNAVFTSNDKLLRQVGMVMVYYHLFRLAADQGWSSAITRRKLVRFDSLREKNREIAEKDLATAHYDLIEFDGLSQSPNDAFALKLRLRLMMNVVFRKNVKMEDL